MNEEEFLECIINDMIIEAYSVPNGVRSNKRTKKFGENFGELLEINKPMRKKNLLYKVETEVTVYTSNGTKRIDIIVDDSNVINCIFPTRSIGKNISNSLAHVDKDTDCKLIESKKR